MWFNGFYARYRSGLFSKNRYEDVVQAIKSHKDVTYVSLFFSCPGDE
jgi:hypothetical protein